MPVSLVGIEQYEPDVLESARLGDYRSALRIAHAYQEAATSGRNDIRAQIHQERSGLLLGRMLLTIGYRSKAKPFLKEALRADDPADRVTAAVCLAELGLPSDEWEELIAEVDAISKELAHQSADEGQRLLLLLRVARAIGMSDGDKAAEAVDLLDPVIGHPHLSAAEEIHARLVRSRSARYCGLMALAEEDATEALAVAESEDDLLWIGRCKIALAHVLIDIEDMERATGSLTSAQTALANSGLLHDLAVIANALGEIDRFSGAHHAASNHYRRAIQLWTDLDAQSHLGLPRANLLILLLDNDRVAEAGELWTSLEGWRDQCPDYLRLSLEFQHLRLLQLEGKTGEAIEGLSKALEGNPPLEVDDALALQWLVEQFIELPKDRRPLQVLFSAAQALSAAEQIWHRLERDDNLQEVQELRAKVAALLPA